MCVHQLPVVDATASATVAAAVGDDDVMMMMTTAKGEAVGLFHVANNYVHRFLTASSFVVVLYSAFKFHVNKCAQSIPTKRTTLN